ncbi:dTDP-4-dehydrorhamnose 3,5-epimerase [Cupriavidus sp. AU9028]|uniref:dTDP-4-dehydrorhamnose 3,5-epimerase n=1 Tax=Cupriavidus sp. AU9028 TaxID=2871157 RepID=UPI001C94A1AA|nr:dTDP-4-dehydrorhamnose 3,5-epimerase [Cupriavidus sp. AU9028]
MRLQVTPTRLPEVLVLEPAVHEDARGFFFESFNARDFAEAIGRDVTFVQDNHSRSMPNVLRGLHYQLRHPQGKLVRAIAGEIFDVAVDLRRASPRFGQWAGVRLSAQNHRQLWVPEGFAHGFLVVGQQPAEVLYKTTDFWVAGDERAVVWDDADIGVAWPLAGPPLLSDKDARAVALRDAQVYDAPTGGR